MAPIDQFQDFMEKLDIVLEKLVPILSAIVSFVYPLFNGIGNALRIVIETIMPIMPENQLFYVIIAMVIMFSGAIINTLRWEVRYSNMNMKEYSVPIPEEPKKTELINSDSSNAATSDAGAAEAGAGDAKMDDLEPKIGQHKEDD